MHRRCGESCGAVSRRRIRLVRDRVTSVGGEESREADVPVPVVRCVRESVEHCAVRFAQCSVAPCMVDCASADRNAHSRSFTIDDRPTRSTVERESNTQRALWQSGGGTHDTGPTPAEHSAVDSGPPRRAAAAGGAAPAPARVPFRYAHAWIWYWDCERHMCYATCFISWLRNRLLSSLSFLKGDRGPSLPSAARTAGE